MSLQERSSSAGPVTCRLQRSHLIENRGWMLPTPVLRGSQSRLSEFTALRLPLVHRRCLTRVQCHASARPSAIRRSARNTNPTAALPGALCTRPESRSQSPAPGHPAKETPDT